MSAVPPISPYEEHLFWLQALEDHCSFILDALADSETHWKEQAGMYRRALSDLRLAHLRDGESARSSAASLQHPSKSIYPVVAGYNNFEGLLQSMVLMGTVQLSLPPTYLNGTLSGNEEYIRRIGYYSIGKEPPELPLANLLDLCLAHQRGHAMQLHTMLAATQPGYSNQMLAAAQALDSYRIRQADIKGYLRHIEPGFSEQNKLASDVYDTVLKTIRQLNQLIEQHLGSKQLPQQAVRYIEHLLPESGYLLRKLSAYLPHKDEEIDWPLEKISFTSAGKPSGQKLRKQLAEL